MSDRNGRAEQSSSSTLTELRQAWMRLRPVWQADVSEKPRGVAILIVLVSVALIMAISTEFAYNSRIRLRVSSNLVREVQAYYHARSSVEISRMVIRSTSFAKDLLALSGRGGSNIEVWKYACQFSDIFNSGKVAFFGIEMADLKEESGGVGVSKGGFDCKVEAEDGRVNVNDVDNVQGKQRIFSSLFGYVRGPDADPQRFDQDDRDRAEIILNMMDWADPDTTATDLDPNMNIVPQGGSSEDFAYSKQDYEPKNAKYDSVEEVRLVEGMDDETFCALRDQITVYSTEKLNVNAADVELIKAVYCQSLTPEEALIMCGTSQLQQAPVDLLGGLIEQCRTIKSMFFSNLWNNNTQFSQFFQNAGGYLTAASGGLLGPITIPVPRSLSPNIGFRGRIIRVTGTGQVGPTVKTISAVVDTRNGKYVYWGEK